MSTFALVTLVYPVLLAVLCIGAGLLVDRASAGLLPGALLPVVGAAALIAVSQLTTYVPALAPATPYALVAFAAAGFVLGGRRALALARVLGARPWQVALPVLAYLLALAPVLLSGRLTFSGYGVLPDSALHMIGADYLIRHGQEYAHLDLRNSYGQYISAYFNLSYPSGSHTLFGGSASVLDLPLIWALQPFCAFTLATATGPAWLLVRRIGLDGAWAAVAALTVTLPALVFGYELVASLKEVVVLPLILALGALVLLHPRWLRGAPAGGIPFALVVAAGVSALGVAFGAWAIVAVAVLLAMIIGDAAAGRRSVWRALPLVAVGLIVGFLAAWPTWIDVTGSFQVAKGIASTANPGNLSAPLHIEQVFGAWLAGSYRHRPPMGNLRLATYALIAVNLLGALLGVVHVIRIRAHALAGWLGLLLILWLGLTAYGTTWADAKLLMLTSPLVLLLAWAGVAGLRGSRLRLVAPIVGLVIGGGVIASDIAQYHGTDLAPTGRYKEMASLSTRFAGQGPVLFTDFDEWSLYELRNLDIGGPNFIFPPTGLTDVARGHGDPVDLDLISAGALRSYPLIVTRRDPTISRPPSVYHLAWEGTYYQVWARPAGAPAAITHLGLPGQLPLGCPSARRLARLAAARHAQLVSASSVEVVPIDLAQAQHPTWLRAHPAKLGFEMTRHGLLAASFQVPHAAVWNVWVQGEIMPAVRVAVDGRHLGSIRAELSGGVFNPDTVTPLPVSLTAGRHRLTLSRGGLTLAPGDGGSTLLHAVFLAPAGAQEQIAVTPPARWRTLCAGRYDWIEVTPAA